MLDFLFSGWGAFWVTMAMLLPFAGMFWYVIHRKSVVDSGPGTTPPAAMSRLEGYWLTAVFVIFVTINLASLKFMPIMATAHAATGGVPVQEVELTATSWKYEMSTREVEAGKPVRFSGRAKDTQHGFRRVSPGWPHAVHHAHDAGRVESHQRRAYLYRAGHLQDTLPGVLRHRPPWHEGRADRRQEQSRHLTRGESR
jgi:hypothetical protein